jgi:hypothetical protein
MIRHLVIFGCFFAIGALLTLAVRTARHDPHAVAVQPPPAASAAPADAAPAPAAAAPAASAPVNTMCALCGMEVDPAIPTALYRGKVIGFGCKACPPRFAADPERYGPAALANQVVE